MGEFIDEELAFERKMRRKSVDQLLYFIVQREHENRDMLDEAVNDAETNAKIFIQHINELHDYISNLFQRVSDIADEKDFTFVFDATPTKPIIVRDIESTFS